MERDFKKRKFPRSGIFKKHYQLTGLVHMPCVHGARVSSPHSRCGHGGPSIVRPKYHWTISPASVGLYCSGPWGPVTDKSRWQRHIKFQWILCLILGHTSWVMGGAGDQLQASFMWRMHYIPLHRLPGPKLCFWEHWTEQVEVHIYKWPWSVC